MHFAFSSWQGKKLLDMFNIGVSLAVAAIPEEEPIPVQVVVEALFLLNTHQIMRTKLQEKMPREQSAMAW